MCLLSGQAEARRDILLNAVGDISEDGEDFQKIERRADPDGGAF